MARTLGRLLVEGPDDREVVYHFCNHHEIDNEAHFEVEACKGYHNLRERLAVLPRTQDRVIGAIVDADVDLAGRWQSLKGVLQDNGYELPDGPRREGTIVTHGLLPRVGIWVMPNNEVPGMLEDFIRFLIPAGDALLPIAAESTDRIPAGHRRFPDVHRPKAIVHTWLAWQREPGTPLGLAIKRRYLDADCPHAQAFQRWLRDLFLPAEAA